MTGTPVYEDHPGSCEEVDRRRPERKVKVVTVHTRDVGGSGDGENSVFFWRKNGQDSLMDGCEGEGGPREFSVGGENVTRIGGNSGAQ